MPNRILRDWTDSDRLDALSAEAERFFVRLLMKADDFGRYHGDEKRLKAFLFPLKPHIPQSDIAGWLQECIDQNLVTLYHSDGKQYLEIQRFGQRLRKMRSSFPRSIDSSPRSIDRQPPSTVDPETKRNETNLNRIESNRNEGSGGCTAGDSIPGQAGHAASKNGTATHPHPPLNHPPLEEAVAHFKKPQNGSYTSTAIKRAFLSFEASTDDLGNWFWGKRLVTDWRAAMESRIQADLANKKTGPTADKALHRALREIDRV